MSKKKTAKYDPRLYCRQPDHDGIGNIECGAPLPCPYHTLIIRPKNDADLVKSIEALHKVKVALRGKRT